MPNWRLLQNHGSFNPSRPLPALEMRPGFSFSPTISTSNYSIHGQYTDLDSLVISHVGSGTENGNSTLHRGLNFLPSRDGSNGNLALEASLEAPSLIGTKFSAVGSKCPRVFCLSACGDLHLSNTGLLGIHCSCHGSHMSVSNFCKHSGLSDVNPGYAVHTDTGECIAQWRKLYLQKFGIRAPDDHRGWDWPEGLLTTSSLLRSNTAVQGGKVFDLSSLFASSAESIKSSQPRHNVFPSNLQLSHDCANKMSKTEHPINPRNSCSMMDSPLITCHEPSSFMTSRVCRGGSRNDCQSSPFHSKIISASENLFGLPYQNVHSTGSKMNNNLKDEIVLQKGSLLSSTELKLGQPSQQGWCVGSTTLPTMRSNIGDLETIPVQEQVTNKLGNSKVIEQGNQPLHFYSATDLRQTKEQFQLDLLNNALSSANTASSLKHSIDWLYNSSEKSLPIPSSNTAAGGNSVHHQEINMGVNESHNFIPWKLHSQSYVDKSRLMEFSCNGGDVPIRPLGIQGSAVQKKEKSTKITKYATVEKESSKLYVHQMENSGFLTKGVKHSHPNSCTIPDENVYSFGMAGMLPDAYFHSNRTGNVGSLGSIPDPGHVSSSLGFGVTKTMHTRSLGFTPLTMTQGIGHDSASLDKDVHAVNSQRSEESWRFLTLGSTDQGSMGLNRQPRIHHDQRERINNCNISIVGVGSAFLDPRPSKGRYDHLCNIGHDTAQTFFPDIGDKKGGNDGHETTMEGLNNWDGLRVFMCGMPSNSEVTDKYAQGPCAPQPKEPCSPRGGNEVSGCMLPRCCQGSHTHISGCCCCTDPSICSNRKWYSKDTSVVNRLEKQVSIAVVKASKLDGSILSDNSTAIEKAVIVEYNQKMKEPMHLKLDCMGSQWRHVPPKANPISELSLNSLGKLPGKKGESETHSNEAGAKGVSSDQIVELQENELSKISSGSSAPAVTHASNEVDNIDCCTADAIDTGKCNDQLVDQGSVINLSFPYVDVIDSGKSCQDAYCGKARSIEEEFSEKLPNVPSHGCADAFKLSQSESNELLNSGESGSDYGRVSNTMQKNENGSTPRKRKHGMKWKTMGPTLALSHVSLLPSESPLQTRNAPENHAHASEVVHVFRQSNHDSSNILDANIKYSSFKRRPALPSFKMLSRKRDLNRIYNTLESGSDDQRLLRGHGNSVVMPENIAVKRLRLVEAAISVMKPVKAAKHACYCNPDTDETLNCSLQLQKPVSVSHGNVCNQKEKPIACGKYGILCNRELDLDQLKPPKIVPLTQVLKSSTKHSKFANDHELASVRNIVHFTDGRKSIYGHSTHSSVQVRKLLSCEVGFREMSAQTLQTYHKENAISPNDCSTPGQVGVNESESNPNFRSSHPSAQSKQKESRVRSLYELSMKGKECISADFSLCQTVISMECEPERKGCKSTEDSNGAECSSFARRSLEKPACSSVISEFDALCCVCGISSDDNSNSNFLLECGRCFIQVHQGCYGISRVPKGDWYCRPCNTGAKNVACVLCGYGGGAMTRAFGSRRIVKSLLKAWNIRTESHTMGLISAETLFVQTKMDLESARFQSSSSIEPVMHNSIIAGSFDRTVRQWVHMICGLWTPGSRCPNVATMSAFDVSDVSSPKAHMVCNICKRSGGPCTQCYVETCSSYVHPWCSHQKGLLQSDVEGVIPHKVRFSGRCLLHANHQPKAMETDNDTDKVDSENEQEKEPTCARTEVYRGKNLEGKHSSCRNKGKFKCLVTQVQLDAWLYINRQKLSMNKQPKPPVSDADHDYRKEYTRYKQVKGWKQLVVYKSGIHALGLYTSQFIPRSAMVVEYIGQIVGPRVADKRESEYLGGRKLQYKGACYFFRIDKEQIIDATRKGGIARFVNHSCQPNCVAKVITVRSEKKVVFFAQRDIDPGEEITYDYHFNHEDEGKKIPCFCKSSNCRRYLN